MAEGNEIREFVEHTDILPDESQQKKVSFNILLVSGLQLRMLQFHQDEAYKIERKLTSLY